MEGFFASFGASPWGPMALAFLFGFAFGWIVWGYRRSVSAAASDHDGEPPEPKEFVVIRAELQAARALLDKDEEKSGEAAEQLAALDDAVKNAGGRLNSMLAAANAARRRK